MVRQEVLDSFVARIWLEKGPNGEPIWRGHIRHVHSELEAYFQDLRGMSLFLEQVSGVPALGTSASSLEDAEPSRPPSSSAQKRKK